MYPFQVSMDEKARSVLKMWSKTCKTRKQCGCCGSTCSCCSSLMFESHCSWRSLIWFSCFWCWWSLSFFCLFSSWAANWTKTQQTTITAIQTNHTAPDKAIMWLVGICLPHKCFVCTFKVSGNTLFLPATSCCRELLRFPPILHTGLTVSEQN